MTLVKAGPLWENIKMSHVNILFNVGYNISVYHCDSDNEVDLN